MTLGINCCPAQTLWAHCPLCVMGAGAGSLQVKPSSAKRVDQGPSSCAGNFTEIFSGFVQTSSSVLTVSLRPSTFHLPVCSSHSFSNGHNQKVHMHMVDLMSSIICEGDTVSQELLDTVLVNLVPAHKVSAQSRQSSNTHRCINTHRQTGGCKMTACRQCSKLIMSVKWKQLYPPYPVIQWDPCR